MVKTAEDNVVPINHLGKTLKSVSFDGIVNEDIVKEIQNGYYKGDRELAIEQLKKVLNKGMSKTNDIYAYYFERVANDTKMTPDKWTINEVLQSKEIIQMFYNRTLRNEKMYPDTTKVLPNFRTAIRLGGKGICRKPTQFPIKVMRELLDDYTKPGDLYYDPCCGWGMRMLVSAEKGVKYIGNDVNMDLVGKLNEFGQDINTIKDFKYAIIPQGSEIYLPHLENKVDFIFTSPPYFNLEQYGGEQLTKKLDYAEWLRNFIVPLLQNCKKYIKEDKYILINIKDITGYPIYTDTKKLGIALGLELVQERDLKQTNRTHMVTKHGDSSEKIMVFKKGNN